MGLFDLRKKKDEKKETGCCGNCTSEAMQQAEHALHIGEVNYAYNN